MNCMTLSCAESATNTMTYTMFNDGTILRDLVCRSCLESYRRRNAIRILAVGPAVELHDDIVAPGLG